MVLGIVCAIAAILYAEYELSYDQWVPDKDRTYRLESYYHFPGSSPASTNGVGGPTGEVFANSFSEIEDHTRMFSFQNAALKIGDRAFNETITFVNPNFVSFMGLDILQGQNQSNNTNLSSLLISEEMAFKFFGETNSLGQTLTLNGRKEFNVTGVFKNIPNQSHLDIGFIALFDENFLAEEFGNENVMVMWNIPYFNTYVRLDPNASITALEGDLGDFVDGNFVHPNPARANMTPTDYVHFGLRPVQDIHLGSPHQNEIKPTGSLGAVLGGLAIAFMIVVIAVFNYISLITATATLRAKEISMRKVMGASIGNIRKQFLMESIFLCVIASVIGVFFVELLLPTITSFVNLEEGDLSLYNSDIAVILILFIGPIVGLIAGYYPAVYLANIRPAKILGTNNSEGKGISRVRIILVTIQFAMSIGLMISVIVVARQTNFLTSMDIGVMHDNISVIRHDSPASQKIIPTLLNEIRALTGVIEATAASTVTTDGEGISTAVLLPGRSNDEPLSIMYLSVDQNYLSTFGLELIEGRFFSQNFANDLMGPLNEGMENSEVNVVINSSAVSFFGFEDAQHALNSKFQIGGSNLDNKFTNVNIVGVVNDFQLGSGYDSIQPLIFINRPVQYFNISVRSKPEFYNDIQNKITEKWAQLLPNIPLRSEELNELITKQYISIDRNRAFLFVLAGVAIFTASLGLFGMAAFSVERRTKELGIRKILGARGFDILSLFLLQFAKPVLLANIFAWPMTYYMMNTWLNDFQYRIDLTPIYFIAAALAALLIAWTTVFLYVSRVISTNPVDALQHNG